MSDIKLTEEQKELVEKNHNLIYAYARNNNLYIDEYYDILAIALCKAANIYDDSKGKFSTLAFRCMTNEVCAYWNEMQKQSAVPSELIVSYDTQSTSDDPENRNSFLEVFSDYESYNDMMYATMLSDIKNVLTNTEFKMLDMLSSGMTQQEIANKIGCKKQNINYHVNNIRDKVVSYLNYN